MQGLQTRGTLWQPRGVARVGKWEGGSRGRRHMYIYGWSMLMHGRNHYYIVIILKLKMNKFFKKTIFGTAAKTGVTDWFKYMQIQINDLRHVFSIVQRRKFYVIGIGGGHGNPLQCFCLQNAMGRGAWRATVHRASKYWTWLKLLSTHTLHISQLWCCQ